MGQDTGAEPADTTGPQLAGYRMLQQLGAGSQGQVWRAEDERTRQHVAVKVLTGEVPDPAAQRELAVLSRLRHPHIVRLRDWGRTREDRLAIVLDEVTGPTLQDLVGARGALDPGEVSTILTPVAQALAHAHARSCVHGDLTPGNLMFDTDGRPLVIDLGVASLLGWQRVERATEGYADPATTAQGRHEAPTDVYALAAIGWFALTGQVPQRAGLRPPLLTLAPQAPAELATLLEQAMSPDVEQRPTAEEFASLAYEACPVVPVRLVDVRATPERALTARLRRRVDEPDTPAPVAGPARRRFGLRGVRPGRPGAGRTSRRGGGSRRRRVVLTVLAAGFVCGVGVAALTWPGQGGTGPAAAAQPPGDSEPGGRPVPSTAGPTDPGDRSRQEGEAPVLQAGLQGTDPVQAVRAISEYRALAFSTGSRQALLEVGAPDSPALAADLAVLEHLESNDVHLRDLGFDLTDMQVRTLSESGAEVEVTVVTTAHSIVTRDGGHLVQERPAGAPSRLLLTLDRPEDRWQVSAIAAA